MPPPCPRAVIRVFLPQHMRRSAPAAERSKECGGWGGLARKARPYQQTSMGESRRSFAKRGQKEPVKKYSPCHQVFSTRCMGRKWQEERRWFSQNAGNKKMPSTGKARVCPPNVRRGYAVSCYASCKSCCQHYALRSSSRLSFTPSSFPLLVHVLYASRCRGRVRSHVRNSRRKRKCRK